MPSASLPQVGALLDRQAALSAQAEQKLALAEVVAGIRKPIGAGVQVI
jgi:hypothetical protein